MDVIQEVVLPEVSQLKDSVMKNKYGDPIQFASERRPLEKEIILNGFIKKKFGFIMIVVVVAR